jgi:hypothetical protein
MATRTNLFSFGDACGDWRRYRSRLNISQLMASLGESRPIAVGRDLWRAEQLPSRIRDYTPMLWSDSP